LHRRGPDSPESQRRGWRRGWRPSVCGRRPRHRKPRDPLHRREGRKSALV
jgi:hypothetical protein